MTSVQPVTDLHLWLRFLAGAALVLWLPGFLLAGRHLRNHAAPTRGLVCVCLGALLIPLWAQFTSLFAAVVRPVPYLVFVLGSTAIFGATELGPRLASALDARKVAPTWLGWSLAAAAGLCFACIVVGFADFVVPPNVHDAANHAFMTLRITEIHSVAASQVFGPPHGAPLLPYALGVHAIASMIAQTVGLAPYVSIWFVALCAGALLPLALPLAWSEWRMSAAVMLVAALLVAANPFVPGRLMMWGLFANAAGLLVTPICVLLLVRLSEDATPLLGLFAGTAIGSLMLIHASEVPTAGLAALLTVGIRRIRPSRNLFGWGAFLVAASICGSHFLFAIMPAYLSGGLDDGLVRTESLALAATRTLETMSAWPHVRILGVIGLLAGLFEVRTRWLAAFGISAIAVAVAQGVWQDPISGLISIPYYRQPERIRYLLAFSLPLLIAFLLERGWQRIVPSAWPKSARGALAVCGVALLVGPDAINDVGRYRNQIPYSPFRADDYANARKLAEIVGPDDWVANQLFDGGAWAMQVSGRHFLAPAGWVLIDPSGRSNKDAAQEFQGRLQIGRLDPKLRFLYVSDLVLGSPLGVTRSRFDADRRFEPVIVGEYSTLYRIRRPSQRGDPTPANSPPDAGAGR